MQIGSLIRKLRTEKGLSLRELAGLTGVSAPTLSQIENGRVSPNLQTLQKIAQALGTSVIAMLATGTENTISLVKRGERKTLIRNTGPEGCITEEFLVTNLHYKMEPAIITLPPYGHTGEYVSHEGEEFVFVLEGEVEVDLHGVSLYTLEEGDTLYYPCTIPHSFRNKTGKPSKILITATPPSF